MFYIMYVCVWVCVLVYKIIQQSNFKITTNFEMSIMAIYLPKTMFGELVL